MDLNKNVLLTAVVLASFLFSHCKDVETRIDRGQEQSSKKVAESPSELQFDTIYSRNAPKRITRNIKLNRNGNLLVAAYDDVLIYDGSSFTPIVKPDGVDSWYAFDALEDRNGNLWVASDQSGAYRVDRTTGVTTHFIPEDGLGHLRNMCVYQDKSGHIWIGGQGGLSQFDGVKFKTYTQKEGLPHNDINTLLEDQSGHLWIGTRGNAAKFDGHTFYELKNDEGEPFFNVWSIMEDRSGIVWLIDSKGLWKYNEGRFTFIFSDVWKIIENSRGGYWFTGMRERASSILAKTSAAPLDQNNLEEVFKSDTMLFGIVEDNEGILWIGGSDGIWRYDESSVRYYTGVGAL